MDLRGRDRETESWIINVVIVYFYADLIFINE